jgi:hypothetical protein
MCREAHLEALAGVLAGLVLSLENVHTISGGRPCRHTGKATGIVALPRVTVPARGVLDLGMSGSLMHGSREIP